MNGSTQVDETLARYSDPLFGTAMAVYVVAAFLFFGALAAVRGRKLEERELVRAGAGASGNGTTTEDRVPGRVEGPSAGPWATSSATWACRS